MQYTVDKQDERANISTMLAFLASAISCTRAGEDISMMLYKEEIGQVIVRFRSGGERHINVKCDSNWAMIKDIVNQLDIG